MTAPLALVVPHRRSPARPAPTLLRDTTIAPAAGHVGSHRPVRVFLSGVKSTTHLVYAASYIRHLLRTSRGPITLVDLGIGRFMGRANVCERDVHDLMPADDRLTVLTARGSERWQAEAGERLVYVGVGAPGIKPYLQLRRTHRLRPIHTVVIDEGIGSYGTWRTRRDACLRQGSSAPWATIRALAVSTSRGVLACERWTLYRDTEPGGQVDPRVAAEFSCFPAPSAPAARTAVFLCQPWVDLGLMEERRYLDHLDEVADACASAGLRLRVRPHPAEDAARYRDFEVTTARGPGEMDPHVAGATVVLGTSSTALLNVASLYGTPALRVAVPELAHLDDQLSHRQRSLLDAYLPPAVPVCFLAGRLAAVPQPTRRTGRVFLAVR